MTRDEAVAEIKVKLGFKTTLDTSIVTALQSVQRELEQEAYLPTFLISDETSMVTVAAQRYIAFPTSFLREYEEDGLFYIPDDTDEAEVELLKDETSFLRGRYPDTGAPQAYSIDTRYNIFPLADDVYTLRTRYYKRAALLTTNVENDWLLYAQKVMIGLAGKKIAEGLRDKDAIALFDQMAKEGRANMVVSSEAKVHENRRYAMGGDD